MILCLANVWLRAGIYYKLDHIDKILSTYRLHADSKTVAQSRKAAPELEYMYRKYFDRDDIPSPIRISEKEALMNMCFTSGGYYLKGGDTENAADIAAKAFELNPAGRLQIKNLHKYLYCRFGANSIYRGARRLVRGNRPDLSY